MLDFLEIGEIVNVHGVRGAVKVIPLTDDVTRFKKLKSVFIRQNGTDREFTVSSVQFQPKFVVMKLAGIESPEAANLLRSAKVVISRANAVNLPKNTYFIGDLIGCTVITDIGETLGKITEVMSPGGNDVYEVHSEDGAEILLPAIKDVILNVDVSDAVVTVHLLPGLREVYDGTLAEENVIP